MIPDELTLYPPSPAAVAALCPPTPKTRPVIAVVIGGCSGQRYGKSRHVAQMVAVLQEKHEYVIVEYDLEPADRGVKLHPYQEASFDEMATFDVRKLRRVVESMKHQDWSGLHALRKHLEETPYLPKIKAEPETKNKPWYGRHSGRKWNR